MVDAVERLVNLALLLAAARGSVHRAQIRKEVAGYPLDQDEEAFLRMFERDKDALKAFGFAIDSDEAGNYRLDSRKTYVATIELSPSEAATLRAAGVALSGDASFPFRDDLRLALAKIAAGLDLPDVCATARLADEEPGRQGALLAEVAASARSRKRVEFAYTNAAGESAEHRVEPYGTFLHDGRWYLVGSDTAKGEVRTYAVARMDRLRVEAGSPKTPAFERPEGFDISSYIRLPFQYGPSTDEFEAAVRFSPQSAWRAASLAGREGRLEPDGEALVWHVRARSAEKLARFVMEHGPGLRLLGPPEAVATLRAGLERAVSAHG